MYTRARFDVPDLPAVVRLNLGADYDDGFVAWINGIEVYRSPEMPPGPPAWNTDATSHESSNAAVPNYAPRIDIAAAGIPALRAGTNVLAIGVWNNAAPGSTDLLLVPRLAANGTSLDNCPNVANPEQTDSDGDGLGDAS